MQPLILQSYPGTSVFVFYFQSWQSYFCTVKCMFYVMLLLRAFQGNRVMHLLHRTLLASTITAIQFCKTLYYWVSNTDIYLTHLSTISRPICTLLILDNVFTHIQDCEFPWSKANPSLFVFCCSPGPRRSTLSILSPFHSPLEYSALACFQTDFFPLFFPVTPDLRGSRAIFSIDVPLPFLMIDAMWVCYSAIMHPPTWNFYILFDQILPSKLWPREWVSVLRE